MRKTLITVLITALLSGGGVYFFTLQSPAEEVPVEADETPEETQEVSETVLSAEYLSSKEWGPESGHLGAFIDFEVDGSVKTIFAGEGDGNRTGSYQVIDDSVFVTLEDGNEHVYTLGEHPNALYHTEYLAEDGVIRYWNTSDSIPEGGVRHYESFVLVTTDAELELTEDAVAKSYPNESDYYNYSFHFCGEGCENGDEESLESVYSGVIARTQFQEEINGVEDYWYLAAIQLDWYSGAISGGEEVGRVSEAWIHGSQLQTTGL